MAVALAMCLVSALAWAFWSAGGSGTANATVGALAAPTAVTPGTPGWGTSVPVSWTGAGAPNGGTVDGYYVQRFSGSTPSPACASSPSALLPAAVTSCSDTSVANGTYTYTVTSVWHSWTATSATSASVTVNALASFTVTAPASATAGSSFTVSVTAKNASNATITAYRGTVHFTSTEPAGAVLPADYTFVAGDNGAHSFANGVTLKTTPSQTVAVADTAEPTKTGTTSVSVTAGAATQLAFTQQPGGGLYNTAWTTQPKVTVQDAYGNTVTTSTASVTLAIGTNPGGGVLTCTTNPKAAVAGVVTFAGCRISKPGVGYTLTATASGLTSATSSVFDVTPGPATKVVYTQQPTAVVAGASISPAVTVTVQDAGSNTVTSSSASITVAIGTNPGGGTLSGTASLNAVNGVATFTNLSINKTGTGYRLAASSTGLTGATSSTFNVTAGAAAQLAFTQQPTGGLYNTAWTTQPKVTVQDALGNTVTTSTASVTLAIGTNPGGGVLTCTANPKAAVAGVVTFAGCKINKPGAGYTLTATARRAHRRDQRRVRRDAGSRDQGRLHPTADRGGRRRGDQPRSHRHRPGRRQQHRHLEQRDDHGRDRHQPRRRHPLGHRVAQRRQRRRDLHQPVDQQDRHRLHTGRVEHRAHQRDQQHLQRRPRAPRPKSRSPNSPTAEPATLRGRPSRRSRSRTPSATPSPPARRA